MQWIAPSREKFQTNHLPHCPTEYRLHQGRTVRPSFHTDAPTPNYTNKVQNIQILLLNTNNVLCYIGSLYSDSGLTWVHLVVRGFSASIQRQVFHLSRPSHGCQVRVHSFPAAAPSDGWPTGNLHGGSVERAHLSSEVHWSSLLGATQKLLYLAVYVRNLLVVHMTCECLKFEE